MKKIYTMNIKKLTIISFFAFGLGLNAQTWNTQEQYIQRFAQYAVEEMEKYKIPASITLAQGILETGGGQSRLAKEGNNHFGIKCKENWTGRTMRHTDDAPNECFRVYNSPRESYEDHSKFLAERKYYTKLFTLDMRDYKAWAHGLKKAGYATHPRYAHILISSIEKHRLYEFDKLTSEQVKDFLLSKYPGLENDTEFMALYQGGAVQSGAGNSNYRISNIIGTNAQNSQTLASNESLQTALASMLIKNHHNGEKKYVVVPMDMKVENIANKYKITPESIMKYNELTSNELKKGDILFLEQKQNSGVISQYISQGETMHQIAQKFGVKLEKLYQINKMQNGQNPVAGQVIYLKDKRKNA